MRTNLKFISGIFLIAISLQSCSSENEETPEINAVEQELQIANFGFMEVDNTTYVLKEDGVNAKFLNNIKSFDFSFIEEINYKVVETKHEAGEILITNPETDEFIKFHHFENLKNGKLKFDVELSTGQKFYSVTYNQNSENTLRWHDDWPVFEPQVFEAVIDMSQNATTASCSDVLAQCANSGGNVKVTIKKNHIWFTAPASCTVSCN